MNIIKAAKCISYACFLPQAHCIVYWIYLFSFLKMNKIKAIKEEIQNNAKVWTGPLQGIIYEIYALQGIMCRYNSLPTLMLKTSKLYSKGPYPFQL